MSDLDLTKKLLDKQPELTLTECIKLAEAVKNNAWDGKVPKNRILDRNYLGTLEGPLGLSVSLNKTSPSTYPDQKFTYVLKVSARGNVLGEYSEMEDSQSMSIKSLYTRVERRKVNELIISTRDYINSLQK